VPPSDSLPCISMYCVRNCLNSISGSLVEALVSVLSMLAGETAVELSKSVAMLGAASCRLFSIMELSHCMSLGMLTSPAVVVAVVEVLAFPVESEKFGIMLTAAY